MFSKQVQKCLVRAGKGDWSGVFIIFRRQREPGKGSLILAEVPEGSNFSPESKEEEAKLSY